MPCVTVLVSFVTFSRMSPDIRNVKSHMIWFFSIFNYKPNAIYTNTFCEFDARRDVDESFS